MSGASPVALKRAPIALVMLALGTGLATMSIYMFNALQVSVKTEMHLSDFDLSLIQGTAVAIPLSLFAMLFGALADRVNRMRLLITMVLVLALATVGTAFASSLWPMFASRVVAATAAAAVLTTSISLGADFSSVAYRGRSMLLLSLGKILGTSAAFAIGAALSIHFATSGIPGWLSTTEPWRATYLIVAFAVAVFAVALIPLGEPARRETVGGPDVPFSRVVSEIWQRRAYLLPLVVGETGIGMADISATIWATPILSRNYGLGPAEIAAWIAPIILGAGILGALIGGYAADWGQRSRVRGGVLLGAVIASGIAVPAALFPLMPNVPAFAAALAIFLLCGTVAAFAMVAVITIDLPNEVRGLCFGTLMAVGGLISYGVAPTIVTVVSGWMGGEQSLAAALALVGTTISFLVFFCFLAAMRAAPTAVARESEV